MDSIRNLYNIGHGPSSSHTIGPERICKDILKHYSGDFFQVTLFGSLNLTGKGHLTDKIIQEVLGNVDIIFSNDLGYEHPNTMDIVIYKNTIIERVKIEDIVRHSEKSEITEMK